MSRVVGTETCICGVEFQVMSHMIDLETKLCEPCFMREAKIILMIAQVKKLKHERPYPLKLLLPHAHKEYDATKKRLLS